jgi:phosphatidylglycerol:prolipoprotein diacylglycerol transferase
MIQMDLMSPASLYLLLWALGCAAGFFAALLVLHRRRVLTPATALAVALAWLFLFIGSKWHSRLEHLPWTQALLVSPVELFAPGRRLPLGLLTSGTAAALACLALRLPWRDVGDALAVFWSVLIPIGRIGCMVYGCCLGTVCPSWLPFGWRYGPGTEAFHLQLAAGHLSPTSTVSLPVHPLPLYFALASLGTLAILVWLLRRAAPPGTLLLTFCLLRPATKLALEPLRAEPALPWLMIGIPAATLGVAIPVALSLLVRRVRIARGRRLATATLLPLAVLAITAPSARADAAPLAVSLQKYAQDPLPNRRLLRRLEREGRNDHSPAVLLALADARLRSGSFAAAERLFTRVTAAGVEEPFATWAILGRGWAAVLDGTTPDPVAPDGNPVAAIMQGLVTSRRDEADRSFARVVADGRASSGLRAVAFLAAAYAAYWAHEDDGSTIAAFDEAAASADGSLVDDARYGAARARIRAGDVAGALPILHDLATWHSNGRPGPASAGLVALDRQAIFRAGFVRYRRGAVRTPEDQLHVMLDGDGAALARAALRDLGETLPEPRPVPRPRVHRATVVTRAAPPVVHATTPPTAAPSRWSLPSLAMVARWTRVILGMAALLAAMLLAHTWWWERRIPPGGRHDTRVE